MDILGVVLFAVTYGLLSARRLSWLGLDRPAVALAGAVACVALGSLSPAAALEAVDDATILLLLGMMGMGAFLAVGGFFDELEPLLLAAAQAPVRLLGGVVWGAGILSAFITNDAVCVLGTPLIVRLVQRHRLPAAPLLLALATGANTGSVATLVGNPQNMLCGFLGQLSYLDFALRMAPVALLGLAINHALLVLLFRRELSSVVTEGGERPVRWSLSWPNRATLLVLLGTAVACAAGAPMDWTAAAGFVALLLLHRRDARLIWPQIDWALLLFFGGLFVVVEGLVSSGAPAWFFARYPLEALAERGLPLLSAVFLVGANLVSNVPFILVIEGQMARLPDPTLGWTLLAMASTFAGNLTLLGSAANVIVAEGGREIGGLGFWQHLRVGAPLALLTTALGTAWLMFLP